MQARGEAEKIRNDRRKHVKSGCRTCKIRKVKCDEGRPACNRCKSTGRTCDGYGIWGVIKPSGEDVLSWIVRSFSRLYVQINLLSGAEMGIRMPHLLENRPLMFIHINDGWYHLERVLCDIISLGRESCGQWGSQYNTPFQRGRKASILQDLTWWQRTFELSSMDHVEDSRRSIGSLVLSSFHAMATVMANACFAKDETVYDSFIELFLSVLSSSARNWLTRSPVALSRHLMNMPRSIVDIGWIPPLYYTAIKCRIPRIRFHAIRLLETTSHREGIWDARIAAATARKVVQIEEGSLQYHAHNMCSFQLDQVPENGSLSSINMPNDSRVSALQVVLPDEPGGNTIIRYVHAQCWKESVVLS